MNHESRVLAHITRRPVLYHNRGQSRRTKKQHRGSINHSSTVAILAVTVLILGNFRCLLLAILKRLFGSVDLIAWQRRVIREAKVSRMGAQVCEFLSIKGSR